MKILILSLTSLPAGSYHKKFLFHLFKYLKKNHKVGIVSNNGLAEGRSKLPVKTLKQTILSNWDIVLVQENISLLKSRKMLQGLNKPIIFFSHDTTPDNQPILMDNLVKVVATHKSPLREWIWPTLAVNKPYLEDTLSENYQAKDYGKDGPFKILIAHNSHDLGLLNLKSFTYFVNYYLLDHEVTLLLESRIRVRQNTGFVNRNVKIVSRSDFDAREILNFDLVIASESDCIASMLYGVPTIVAGPKGFGGFVTENDIEEHLNFGFTGRLGGELGEIIPYWVLVDEFDLFKENQKKTLANAAKIKKRLSELLNPETIFPIIEADIIKTSMMSSSVDGNSILVLRPWIQFSGIESNQEFIIQNSGGVQIGLISVAEKSILDLCDGSKSISQIAKLTNTSTQELVPFCIDLWFQNIVMMKV